MFEITDNAMSLLMLSGAGGSSGGAGSDSSDNNPDSWSETGNLWMDVAYETQVNEEKSFSAMVTNAWASNYGRGGSGGWRAIPNDGAASGLELHSGWAGAAWDGGSYSSAGNGSSRFFLSFTMLISQNMLTNVFAGAVGRMKFLDAACGAGNNRRWVMNLANNNYTSDGLKFGFAAGGASTDLYEDGTNTNWNLQDYPDEFIWFCVVYDETNTSAYLYGKREGDAGVTKLLFRDETTVFGSDFYESGSGWSMPLQSIGGYWDWERESYFTYNTNQYMTLDDMMLSDYWTGPPW